MEGGPNLNIKVGQTGLSKAPEREAADLVVAQEKLAAFGWQSPLYQVLGEVRHVGAM